LRHRATICRDPRPRRKQVPAAGVLLRQVWRPLFSDLDDEHLHVIGGIVRQGNVGLERRVLEPDSRPRIFRFGAFFKALTAPAVLGP